ncbi:MAG: FkbM family methyltransferase [Bryobacterales bacterium]|nr:FkbM family methyltransferase [Bryobacterales bacterium]
MLMITNAVNRGLRALGYEIVRFPAPNWVRNRQLMRVLFPRLGIDCVLDVGANQGQFGLTLRESGYQGRIVSFEPGPEAFDVLRQVAARDGNWTAFPFALGETSGTLELNIAEESVFSSFLTPLAASVEQFPTNRTVRRQTVPVRRLDEVFAECTAGHASPRVYLKMDTQGFDLEVFRGAAGVLPAILAMQSEICFQPIYEGMRGYADNLAEYHANGFEVYDFLVVNRDLNQLAVVEMDCVLIRANALAGPRS